MYYPNIDPIFLSIGPIDLRWYGLTYVIAFIACYLLGNYRSKKFGKVWTTQQWSDLVFYGMLGTLIGGRLGYALFYDLGRVLQDPLVVFRIWEGGMSFHGGLLGVLTAFLVWGRLKGESFFKIADFVAPLVSLGIGFGRLGNFANTELPGRVTESFLGFHFPCHAVVALNPNCIGEYEPVLRHVSSLYQAFTTGVIVFAVVWIYSSRQRPLGSVTGLFLTLYGLGRFCTEFFREPDAHLGFILGNWLSMGQLLSLPLIAGGFVLLSPPVSKYLQKKKTGS